MSRLNIFDDEVKKVTPGKWFSDIYFPLFERSFLEMKTIEIILSKTMSRLFSKTRKARLMDTFGHSFKPPARVKGQRYSLEHVFCGEPGSSYLWERIFASFREQRYGFLLI